AAAARLPDQGRDTVEGAGSRRPRHSAVRDRPMSNIEGPHIEGIDRITYGVEDLAACKRFFLDWGLRLVHERAEPVEVGHVVFFTDALAPTTAFYEALGFRLSDRYPGRGHFLRCSERGGHHDL